MNVEQVLGLYNYWIVIFLMMTGFYIVIARQNMIKSVIGLNIFQTSVFLLYITMGKVNGGTAPIIPPRLVNGHADTSEHAVDHIAEHAADATGAGHAVSEPANSVAEQVLSPLGEIAQQVDLSSHVEPIVYSNPMPSVLMLTAIVVGIATTSLALALIVRIREEYGTIEEDKILELDRDS
ncbi:putative monovalent cation/H+ antiporter subunit C [Novipirellula galeiformis]|uniref:Putative monovalent cation/H+ antiporter subunit C n=1 Tax=Novipirellula galeiformis TaxID=2528004 RepID=A0A5C6CJI8_9BACT|nr:cation:proton antiporter subunit C [Novipirellula galeiformis]TWU23316.1 putative monovalent cation/H+ antiporter subunit C [Novipirellula galeiformis]